MRHKEREEEVEERRGGSERVGDCDRGVNREGGLSNNLSTRSPESQMSQESPHPTPA